MVVSFLQSHLKGAFLPHLWRHSVCVCFDPLVVFFTEEEEVPRRNAIAG